MRVLGADLAVLLLAERKGEGTIVALDPNGRLADVRSPSSFSQAVQAIVELAAGDPFLLAVNLPVVVPAAPARTRPVENLIRRRLGHRLPPGGRSSLAAARGGAGGEVLLAALAAAGAPCLPYPDRDRRTSGLAEIHPALVAKALIWAGSFAATSANHPDREQLFRACEPLRYRIADAPKTSWSERAIALDATMRLAAAGDGFDGRPVTEALSTAVDDSTVERAGGLFDASLLAVTARRYLETPEECAFVGNREDGYVILPADGLIRRLALREGQRPGPDRLFPKASLRERLAPHASLRPLELVALPGRPRLIEASFEESKGPRFEFDNLDEMMWWKHCRHLAGPEIPLEGLQDIYVRLDGAGDTVAPLRLQRSRHRVLSFRFEPPSAWRGRIAPRDGKTYAFRVVRATYEARGDD